jgi:hypothetical protein
LSGILKTEINLKGAIIHGRIIGIETLKVFFVRVSSSAMVIGKTLL